jgi:hypothetical protein
LGRFVKYGPALQLILAALAVLGIRSLHTVGNHLPAWTVAGLRAGFVGALIIMTVMSTWIASPFFDWMEDRTRWSKNPEGRIVIGLLRLLSDLSELENIRRRHDELTQATLATQKRRDEKLQQLTEKAGAEWRETTEVTELPNGTFLETYKLAILQNDGSWKTLLQDERVSHTADPCQEDPQWRTFRQKLVNQVEDIARYVERGLPAKLGVGDRALDGWLRLELRARAQTIRNWARSVVFQDRVSYEEVIAQVATTLEHAAEERWAAITKSKAPVENGFLQRLLRFTRNVSVGVIPLVILAVAPTLSIQIPLPLRDSLLTFAVPWTLLQVLELAIPHASDYLSRSKDVRELLPSIGKPSSKE